MASVRDKQVWSDRSMKSEIMADRQTEQPTDGHDGS